MIIDRKNKEKKKEKKEDENDDNKGKIRKDSKKKKMEISRGGVTRPPSQFESYSLSASSKSYMHSLHAYEFGDLPQLFHFVSYRCSICI